MRADLDVVSILELSTQKTFTERNQEQRQHKLMYLTCNLIWF